MSRTTIVIPCFNEEHRLPLSAIEAFAQTEEDVHLLMVDDGSRDGTAALLRDLASRAPRIDVESLPRNMGKGEAVRRGLLAALDGEPTYVGFWDADLAAPLEAVAELREVMETRPEIEMVFGSRVKLLGRSVERNAARHYLGRVFATAVSLALGVPVYDTQCGAKLFRANAELRRLLSEPFVSRWIFDVEILARLESARRAEGRPGAERVVYEHPMRRWHHVEGSKVRPGSFVTAARDLLRIWLASRSSGALARPPARG